MKTSTSVSWHEKPEKRHKVLRETDVAMLTSVSRRMFLFLLVLRDGPGGGFREHGVLFGKDGEK